MKQTNSLPGPVTARGVSALLLLVWAFALCPAAPASAADFAYRWIGSNAWAAEQGCNVNIAPGDQKPGVRYYQIWGGFHTIGRLMPAKTYYEEHPEYFALVDGRRVKQQPCLSNPDVRRVVAENLIYVIEDDPELGMVTLGLPDNRKFCECRACRALDEQNVPADQKYTRRVLDFYTAIAEQVHRQYPDMPIRFGFYDVYAAAPADADLPENCIPFICHFQKYCNIHPVADPKCEYNARFRDIVRGWNKIAEELFIYEYYYKVNWLSMPWPLLTAIKKDIAWYRDNGVTGFYSQSRSNAPGCALNLYVAAHMLINSQADVHDLIDEFCKRNFGPAGKEMRDYFMSLEQSVQESGLHIPGRGFAFPHAPEVFSPKVMEQSMHLLHKAGKAVRGTQFEQAVDRYITLMEYTRECVSFLNQAREALGPGRLGVEEQQCRPKSAAKAFKAGIRLQKKLENNALKYQGIVRGAKKSNPYLRMVLVELNKCVQEDRQ